MIYIYTKQYYKHSMSIHDWWNKTRVEETMETSLNHCDYHIETVIYTPKTHDNIVNIPCNIIE